MVVGGVCGKDEEPNDCGGWVSEGVDEEVEEVGELVESVESEVAVGVVDVGTEVEVEMKVERESVERESSVAVLEGWLVGEEVGFLSVKIGGRILTEGSEVRTKRMGCQRDLPDRCRRGQTKNRLELAWATGQCWKKTPCQGRVVLATKMGTFLVGIESGGLVK